MAIDAQLDESQLATLRLLRNGQLLGNLIRTYRTQTQQQLLKLRQALDVEDTANIATIAHSMKSASFTLGATQMGQLSTTLESAAMQCDVTQCRKVIMALQENYDTLLPALAREERP